MPVLCGLSLCPGTGDHPLPDTKSPKLPASVPELGPEVGVVDDGASDHEFLLLLSLSAHHVLLLKGLEADPDDSGPSGFEEFPQDKVETAPAA